MAAITRVAKALQSATTNVDVSAATAPSSGQVLTATGTTAATWQTPSSGGFTSQVHAYSGATQAIPTGFASRETVEFNTETYDTGNEFNTTTYTFTAGSTGYYQVNFTAQWASWAASAAGCEVYFVVNGSEKLVKTWDYQVNGAWTNNYSTIIKLTAAQTLSFKMAQYTGSDKNVTSGEYTTFVTIARVA